MKRLRPDRLLAPLALAALFIAPVVFAVEQQIMAAAFSSLRPGNALPASWSPLAAANIKVHTRYAGR